MIHVIVCALALLAASEENDAPPEHIKKYLQRCDDSKAAAIATKSKEIKSLAAEPNPTAETKKRLQAAEAELKRLKEEPAPLVPLPLPPEKGDVGIFIPASDDGRGGKSVDVLEVVDEDDAIVRAWYLPGTATPGAKAAREDATFVDLWVHGMDTSSWAAKSPAKLPHVFHVSGNKLIDTTCGKRSFPLLEPLDIRPYRQ